MEPVMDAAALDAFMAAEFPEADGQFAIEALEADGLSLRLIVDARHLRPGGTVSGPAMFALADIAFYLALLSRIGPQALAVTTNCAIDFMRRPEAGVDLIARVRLLKVGRVLAVGDVEIRARGGSAVLARASLTYSIPPAR